MSLAPAANARSASDSSWTSTRASSPTEAASSTSCGISSVESAATMSSTASAPMHLASRTSAGATVKSFLNTGNPVAARATARSSGEPAKNSRSVRTDNAAAPPSW